MNAGNVVQFRRASTLPPKFAVRACGTVIWIVSVHDDGSIWWSDRNGGGKALLSGKTIVIGPYKSYGAAFHVKADEAAREAAEFARRAHGLPGVPDGYSVIHFTETGGWQ